MKALLYIMLGFLITCAGGYGFFMAHTSGQKALTFLSLLAAMSGIVLFFIGLAKNHKDHTRRR
jgi:uncharacterized membrane protein